MNKEYQQFYGKHYAEIYSADTAPDEIILELDMPDNIITRLEDADRHVKEELEKKTKLKVDSFNWRVIG